MSNKVLEGKIKEGIKKAQEDIEELKEQVKPISPENAIGRISRMDAINNKSVIEASLRTRNQTLAGLEVALSRINDADFGLCIRCGQPIPEGRLLLMPHARKCVKCS